MKQLDAGRTRQSVRPLCALASFLLFVALGLPSAVVCAESNNKSLQQVLSDVNFVDISGIPHVRVSLRYASTSNFVGRNIYGDFNRAFLHRIAAGKLERAAQELSRRKPGWKILIFDALRPRFAQRVLWEAVKGTSMQRYVANPKTGSIHNFGLAVDVSLLDENDTELDMGTRFDAFEALAQPALEQKFLKEGKLTEIQVKNRLLLRDIMTGADFIQLPLEWWHFDALPQSEVRANYRIVE